MNDKALDVLLGAIERQPGGLLLADEQVVAWPRVEALAVLTNRVDVAREAQQRGFNCYLSDFDFSAFTGSAAAPVERVYYRVSKEKALVHYLLNQAAAMLSVGGELLLSGYKSDGTKTYIEKACRQLGFDKTVSKGAGGAMLARLTRVRTPAVPLDDSDYTRLVRIDDDSGAVLYSKPGIYGWKKIDKGSALLIEQLPVALAGMDQTPGTVLDLGCGYGYLTVMAAPLLNDAHFIATDSNVTALTACRYNLTRHGINAEVVAADCAEGIERRVDLVLCNPPFHKGFDVHGDLTGRFLQAAAERLAPGGTAVFVVNQFIGIEARADSWFADLQLLTQAGGFKVVALRR